jgi:hypothetical protein
MSRMALFVSSRAAKGRSDTLSDEGFFDDEFAGV